MRLVAIGALGTMLSPAALHLKEHAETRFARILDRGTQRLEKDAARLAWKNYGATLVNTLEALIGDGDIDGVVICAGKNGDDRPIIETVLKLFKKNPRQQHRFILHFSTVSVAFVDDAFHLCEKQNVHYANYPLTGGALGARNGTMLILASGNRAFYEQMTGWLQHIGKPEFLGEDPTLGCSAKLIGHVLVFHGLLGMCMAVRAHQRAWKLSEPGIEQVPFFDFLNQGAGGTRQWDVAIRTGLNDDNWQKGFLLSHAVIDALYTAELLHTQGCPALLITPLITVALLLIHVLNHHPDQATQSLAQLLCTLPPEIIQQYLERHLQTTNTEEAITHCISLLPKKLAESV